MENKAKSPILEDFIHVTVALEGDQWEYSKVRGLKFADQEIIRKFMKSGPPFEEFVPWQNFNAPAYFKIIVKPY